MSLADVVVYGSLRANHVAMAVRTDQVNVQRWMALVQSAAPWLDELRSALDARLNRSRSNTDSMASVIEQAKEISGGPVITRFPPEPSGYLHIGHAKAALLNDVIAHESGGHLVRRFDDTNPSKESQEYQDSILDDLAAIGVKPDRITYSSDYFAAMFWACRQLISTGHAYADDTDGPVMKHQRWHGVPSLHRDADIDVSLARFDKMRDGTKEGLRWCIRAKISVDNVNKALRDPVIYRCNLEPHHRTETTWKIYPTYDFCAPFVDAVEGITLALRTTEYNDRNAQYAWMQQALRLRKVPVWEFGRLSFIQTVLSKRKLAQIVDAQAVVGWDDPRMPTIRGLIRRGLNVATLRDFIREQGPSRNVVTLDWSTLWAINKKNIDPVAPRNTAVRTDRMVVLSINGISNTRTEWKPKHTKNPAIGTKKVVCGNRILIDQDDAKTLELDEEVTLMSWGNAIVTKLEKVQNYVTTVSMELRLDGNVKETKKKLTWLSSDQDLTPVVLHQYGSLLRKDKLDKDDDLLDCLNSCSEVIQEAVADCNVRDLSAGTIIQFERYGYYRIDQAAQSRVPARCYKIPTGR